MSSGPFPTCLAPGRPHGAQADTHASILRHRAPSPGDGPASSHRRGGEQAAVRLPGSRSPAAPAGPAARGRPSPAGLTGPDARGPASAWCPGLGSHRRGRRSRLWSRWPGPCGQALWLRRTWALWSARLAGRGEDARPLHGPLQRAASPRGPIQAPVALSTAPASSKDAVTGEDRSRVSATLRLGGGAHGARTRCQPVSSGLAGRSQRLSPCPRRPLGGPHAQRARGQALPVELWRRSRRGFRCRTCRARCRLAGALGSRGEDSPVPPAGAPAWGPRGVGPDPGGCAAHASRGSRRGCPPRGQVWHARQTSSWEGVRGRPLGPGPSGLWRGRLAAVVAAAGRPARGPLHSTAVLVRGLSLQSGSRLTRCRVGWVLVAGVPGSRGAQQHPDLHLLRVPCCQREPPASSVGERVAR